MKLTKQEWLGKYKNRIKERDYKLLSLAYDILEENTLQGPDYPWAVRIEKTVLGVFLRTMIQKQKKDSAGPISAGAVF